MGFPENEPSISQILVKRRTRVCNQFARKAKLKIPILQKKNDSSLFRRACITNCIEPEKLILTTAIQFLIRYKLESLTRNDDSYVYIHIKRFFDLISPQRTQPH